MDNCISMVNDKKHMFSTWHSKLYVCAYCGKQIDTKPSEELLFNNKRFEENLFKTKSTFGCLNRASARVKGYPWESPEITQKYIREVR